MTYNVFGGTLNFAQLSSVRKTAFARLKSPNEKLATFSNTNKLKLIYQMS